MARIGVFLSKEGAGLNPLNLEDIASKLVENVQEISHVFIHEDLNTIEGLAAMEKEIKEQNIGYVVIGCGSIDKREENIRETLKRAGMNEYLLEVVNLKEMVASVHPDEPERLEKDSALVFQYEELIGTFISEDAQCVTRPTNAQATDRGIKEAVNTDIGVGVRVAVEIKRKAGGCRVTTATRCEEFLLVVAVAHQPSQALILRAGETNLPALVIHVLRVA